MSSFRFSTSKCENAKSRKDDKGGRVFAFSDFRGKKRFFVFKIQKCELTKRRQSQVNLALNKVTYQTDTSGDYFASLVVDGNPSYNFNDGTCSRTLSNDASWEVDLGAIYFVGSVEIYNRVDCCSNDLRDIEIYTGLTRDAYQFVGTRPGPAGLAIIYSPLTMPEFQWLKISRKAGSKAPLTLCEVKVFPSDVTTTQASDVTTTQA
ncbi:pentraxin fusion protein-like, partial [Ruditapes philippinarum]|uniref:pentraxin fusion protein-like n=1 Tax=Ruditapes philippinarum TaxID=129788 RepID=UPI00295B0DCC